jgi:redox-sensing transcriptional repressor
VIICVIIHKAWNCPWYDITGVEEVADKLRKKNMKSGSDKKRIPPITIKRLSKYLRALEGLRDKGTETVSSEELAGLLHIKPSQLRKDLAYFGEFGTRGMGYRINKLVGHLRGILGVDRDWNIAIIGLGNLGTALLHYRGFNESGFRTVCLLDDDPGKVGKKIRGLTVHHIDDIEKISRELNVSIAVITVPAAFAQSILGRCLKAGIQGVLNFAPITLKPEEGMQVISVDISADLKSLSHFMTKTD